MTNFDRSIIEEVECSNRKEIPLENETIADDFEIEKMAPFIKQVSVYLRDSFECPFGRGNWMIDMRFLDGRLFSIKLPKQMKEDDIKKFVQPLIDILDKKNDKL